MKRLLAIVLLALASTGALAGKPCTTCTDQATSLVSGTFTGTGNGTSIVMVGPFNFELSGTWSGTITLERSFDGGTTFVSAAMDTSGTASSYTTNVSLVVNEWEPGVIYRARCTAYVSGTVAYRISSGPRLT